MSQTTETDIIERYMLDDNRIFTMEHLEPAFLLLSIGLTFSCLVFLGEFSFSRFQQRNYQFGIQIFRRKWLANLNNRN